MCFSGPPALFEFGGEIVGGTGFDVGCPQRGAVRRGEELYVAAEALVLAGVPGVDLGALDAWRCPGRAVGLDQGAVQDHVILPFLSVAFQHLVQVWGLGSQDIDAFVQVAVAGGLRDAGITGQAVHAACSRIQRSTSTAWRKVPSAR